MTVKRLRKWLDRDEAWPLLAAMDPANDPRIAQSVEAFCFGKRTTRALRRLGTDERSAYFAEVARVLQRNFLAMLDPSYATALSHHRLERRLDDFDEAISNLPVPGGGLDAELLEQLPIPISQQLVELDAVSDQSAQYLLRRFVRGRRTTDDLEELLADPPPGVDSTEPLVWHAVALFASSLGFHEVAASSFSRARRNGGDDPSRVVTARHALTYQHLDRADGVRLLDDAGDDDPTGLLCGARAVLQGDSQGLVEVWPSPGDIEGQSAQRLAVSLKAAALLDLNEPNEVLGLLASVPQRYDQEAWFHYVTGIARAELADAEPFGSHDHQAHLHHALDHLRAGLDMKRRWRVPAVEEARLAVRAAIAVSEPEVAVAIGAEPPLGNAFGDIAQDPEVRDHVVTALLQQGMFQEAATIGQESDDPYVSTLVEAIDQLERDEPNADLFTSAYELATSTEQRVAALSGLAHLGEDMPQLDELTAEAPQYVALLNADRLMALDRFADALAALDDAEDAIAVRHRRARCYVKLDMPEKAIDLLIATSIDFQHAGSVIAAADLLYDQPDVDEAERVLRTALVGPCSDEDEYQIRARLMQVCVDRKDWRELKVVARAATASSPQRTAPRWALIDAHVQLHELRQAYDEFTRHPRLTPHDEASAVHAIQLLNRFEPGENTVLMGLELARRFRDSEEVRAVAIASHWTSTPSIGLSPQLAAQLRDEWAAFREDFPDSEIFTELTGDDIDAVIEEIRALLEPHARLLDDIAARIRNSALPIGMFADAAQKPYAWTCVNGGPDGTLRSVAGPELLIERETDHAFESLDVDLVFDTTALITAIVTNDTWMTNRQGKNIIAAQTATDIRATELHSQLESGSSVHWNREHDIPEITTSDPLGLEHIRQRCSALAALAATMTEVSYTASAPPETLARLPEEVLNTPWMSAVGTAIRHGVPLVSDDFGLRAVARLSGVPTFGTYAVVQAQHRRQPIDDLQLESALDALVHAGLVDIPGSYHRLIRLANATNLRSPLATMLATRPATWIGQGDEMLAARAAILTELTNQGRLDESPAWAAATALGMARLVPVDQRLGVLAFNLVSAIAHVGVGDAPVAEMIAAIRSVRRRADLDPDVSDPLPVAVRQVRDYLTNVRAMDDDSVGAVIMHVFRGVDDDDRAVVLEALLART